MRGSQTVRVYFRFGCSQHGAGGGFCDLQAWWGPGEAALVGTGLVHPSSRWGHLDTGHLLSAGVMESHFRLEVLG